MAKTYTITAGDTLAKIARVQLGDAHLSRRSNFKTMML